MENTIKPWKDNGVIKSTASLLTATPDAQEVDININNYTHDTTRALYMNADRNWVALNGEIITVTFEFKDSSVVRLALNQE